MRKLIVLGATGSIGVNALEVAAHLGRSEIEVVGLSGHRNGGLLREQAARWRPRFVVVTDADAHAALVADWDPTCGALLAGVDGVRRMIDDAEPDVVLQAMVGAAGLPASLQTVEAGIDLAVANKESIVVAGPLLVGRARERGGRILPVDSEHSAIFQALAGQPADVVKRILLTGSGGPFRTRPVDTMHTITKAEALDHPVWSMGAKITIDSSTMMNKALEIVEARWLFDVPTDKIEVVIHPQGVVHSMVEFGVFDRLESLCGFPARPPEDPHHLLQRRQGRSLLAQARASAAAASGRHRVPPPPLHEPGQRVDRLRRQGQSLGDPAPFRLTRNQ